MTSAPTGLSPARPTGTIDEAAARDHVRDIVARAGSSFAAGMRILPPRRRAAIYAIYAFCREVDDIADGALPAAEKHAKLKAWRAEIAALYQGRAHLPVARALAGPVTEFALPREEFLAIIEGVEIDAAGPVRLAAMADLAAYCRRVAGAVGLLAVRVFGDSSPPAEACALALGEALQLTNILRDLDEDGRRDRLYLPTEMLERLGIQSGDAATTLRHARLPAAAADLALRARERFAEARRLIALCDRRKLRPARIMLETYARLLDRLERRGWERRGNRRLRLTAIEKAWIGLRYGLF